MSEFWFWDSKNRLRKGTHRNDSTTFFVNQLSEMYSVPRLLRCGYYSIVTPQCQKWFLDLRIHRENDLPAEKWKNGMLVWAVNGDYHRDNDKPAIIKANGDLSWYTNNRLHRENGPAREHKSGYCEWWWKGVHLSESDYKVYSSMNGIV